MITREAVQARLDQLRVERQQLDNNIKNAVAKLHGYIGAIVECEHWLSQFTPELKDILGAESVEVVPQPPKEGTAQ